MVISLRAARVNAELTQEDVAKILNVSKTTIVNYETYRQSPNAVRAKELAKLYGVGVDNIRWAKK